MQKYYLFLILAKFLSRIIRLRCKILFFSIAGMSSLPPKVGTERGAHRTVRTTATDAGGSSNSRCAYRQCAMATTALGGAQWQDAHSRYYKTTSKKGCTYASEPSVLSIRHPVLKIYYFEGVKKRNIVIFSFPFCKNFGKRHMLSLNYSNFAANYSIFLQQTKHKT